MDVAEQTAAQRLVAFLIQALKESDGRIRVEDLISASAAIAGERCIEAAGDFNPRHHQFVPGSHVFSDKVNTLICGDVDDLDAVPETSAIGILRDRLLGHQYDVEHFPSIADVFRNFAAKIGDKADWGRVPLTVPEENRPYLMPLRVEFETRANVDKLIGGGDAARAFRIAMLALAEALGQVREAIDPRVVLLLAFETLNGMAKTAPMTAEAFQRVAAPAKPAASKPWWRFW